MSHLRMVSPEQFAALREHFSQADYTQASIRERFNVQAPEPLSLVAFCTRPSPKPEVSNSLDALMHLFLVGEALSIDQAKSIFPPAVWEALTQSELVLVEAIETPRCVASVALFPVRGLFLVADRWTNIDHSVRSPFPDIVYPALTKSVSEYLDYTSFEPCEDFLEICAGSAPAALLAAKTAKQVWAADITERSLAFAQFNAALNGIQNVKFVRGDLFQPVEGRRFDRIAAHPPYMPTLRPTEIFSGGGELGEDLAKKIVAELPARLKPGGRFYCRSLGVDRTKRSFELTVRDWLGERNGEFDVSVFGLGSISTNRFALEEVVTHGGGQEAAKRWEALFEREGVKGLIDIVVVIQHIMEKRRCFTLRRTMSSNTPAAVMEWLMRWEVEMHQESTIQELLQAKPVAVQGTEITARHTFKEGSLGIGEFRMAVKRPFEVDWRVQPWMPLLLPECDGTKTVGEIYERAKKNEWVLPETPAAEFCGVVALMLSGGFLSAEKFIWPEARG